MSQYFDNKEALFLSPKITQQGSQMVMSNVYKNTKTKYINIDTRFHEDYNLINLASFTYNIPQRISDVKSITARNLELPMSYYAFSLNKGNTFLKITKLKTSDSTVVKSDTLIIPNNNYTLETLNISINQKLFDLSMNMDIRYDIYGDYSNFTYLNSNTYYYTIQYTVDSTGLSDKYQLKSKFGWSLGFREPEYTLDYNNKTISSEGPINLINFRYLFLIVDEFKQSNPNSFVSPLYYSLINKNILARIVLDSTIFPYGTVLPANTFNGLLLSDVRTYSGKTDLQKLHIELVDEWGKLVDLNKMDFSFCLEIQYE
jgi:hypothetical protein